MKDIAFSVLSGPEMTRPTTISQAIRDHALGTPDAVALIWRDQELTYGALCAAVERIRAQIPAGDRAPVAVRMRRSPLFVAALLAVLETGAPYLALSPEWSVQRCRQAMAHAGARLCLADGRDGLLELPGLTMIDPKRDAAPDPSSAARRPAPEDGFAVIYTSGSAGTPKCVLSPHSGMFRLAHDPALGFDQTTCTLQAASVGWDGLSLELWVPLLRGGSCVLHDDAYLSPKDVRAAVKRGVNTLWLTASLFNTFIDTEPECLEGLRLLMTGAERVSPPHVARCRGLLPDVRLVNGYGPVEATSVFVSAYDIPASAGPDREVPIGTPLAGTTLYVLDEDHRVTKRGEAGEIAVAGEGIALGYMGDTEATQRAFAVLPLGPGGAPVRVYLTGDRGRVEEDGTLSFLGRLDQRVKIRGVRIDPIEVERVIEGIDGVLRAVVVSLPLDGSTKESLAAFCVVTPDPALTEEQVRSAVAEALPGVCVPRHVRLLRDLPVTVRGKTDTRRLVEDLPGEPEYDARTEAEEAPELVRLVRDHLCGLLKRPVRDEEDIFLAGASSLTAIRLSAQLLSERGVSLSVASIMGARIPARIAELLGEAEAESADKPV